MSASIASTAAASKTLFLDGELPSWPLLAAAARCAFTQTLAIPARILLPRRQCTVQEVTLRLVFGGYAFSVGYFSEY
jgi:hypothetical protein